MLFYPILFFAINQRDQDHLSAELGYSFLGPPQNSRLDSTCPSWPHFPILLFSQWSWITPLDTETKQIRNGCWKIRRVNPTGKKSHIHWSREWPKVWGQGQRPTSGRTLSGTGSESLVFLKGEEHNSIKLTLPASTILNAVTQLTKWKNFSPILVITEDYIYLCYTGANSVVEWAVWKVPLTITEPTSKPNF